MKINKEGYWIIGITGLLCLSIWALVYFLIDTHIAIMWFMSVFLLIFWFFVAAFFREPKRVTMMSYSSRLVMAALLLRRLSRMMSISRAR